jgi:hypothetical protein
MRLIVSVFFTAAVLAPVAVFAQQQITLNARDSGYYESNGVGGGGGSLNYFTGRLGLEHRSFFIFDLPAGIGRVTDAQLRLWNPSDGFVSPDGSEQVAFFDVSAAADRIQRGTGGVAAFDDFGTGRQYASRLFSTNDNGRTITIPLNADAVADANAAIGRPFTIGGRVMTLSGETQQVFGNTGRTTADTQLVLTVVPEPGAALLVVAPMLALLRRR